MQTYLGIEIGGTKLQLVRGDANGRIVERRRFTVDRNRGGKGIRDQIERALPELAGASKPAATGVGFGGPVDWRTGRICCSHQIEGWSEFELGSWLRTLTGAPVVVDNDANVAALGEAIHGAGRGNDPLFYVTLGSGVGGGLVVHRKLYHGAIPGEAEIGHIRLDRQGTILEARCSGWAVDARIRQMRSTRPASRLAMIASEQEGGEARYLAEALREGDSAATKLLAELAEDLGFGLSHVAHLFHPAMIVLGGGLSAIGEPLRAGVEAALGRFVMKAFAPGPPIVLAVLGEDAVPMGALELARAQES
jgi:glucokinase